MTDKSLVGQCFRVETSWGDGGTAWWVYRRVRAQISGVVECHRFEVRASQGHSGPMYVMYVANPIDIDVLLTHQKITQQAWLLEWGQFLDETGEVWNVE